MVKKSKVKELKEKNEELEEKYKRALADYQNLQKRAGKEKEEFIKFANARLLDKLLPILDGLEECCYHLKEKGLGLILDQFKKVLASEGLEEIKAEGEKFDPDRMDAIQMVKGEKNQVVQVVLKGYRLDKVLRPAKVKVGMGIGEKKL